MVNGFKILRLQKNQNVAQSSYPATDNEEAMTVLAKTCTAIANINAGDRMAKSGIDDAMSELVELAGRAKVFHKDD